MAAGGGGGAVNLVEDEPQVDFNDIFSLRRPRDARAGLASGLKSMAKGVAGGVAGLVAAPVVGAKQDGFKGFAKGLGTGEGERQLRPSLGAWSRQSVAAIGLAIGCHDKSLLRDLEIMLCWWSPLWVNHTSIPIHLFQFRFCGLAWVG
jgi:hypothetical protein